MGKLACGFNARKETTKLGKNQGLSVQKVKRGLFWRAYQDAVKVGSGA